MRVRACGMKGPTFCDSDASSKGEQVERLHIFSPVIGIMLSDLRGVETTCKYTGGAS